MCMCISLPVLRVSTHAHALRVNTSGPCPACACTCVRYGVGMRHPGHTPEQAWPQHWHETTGSGMKVAHGPCQALEGGVSLTIQHSIRTTPAHPHSVLLDLKAPPGTTSTHMGEGGSRSWAGRLGPLGTLCDRRADVPTEAALSGWAWSVLDTYLSQTPLSAQPGGREPRHTEVSLHGHHKCWAEKGRAACSSGHTTRQLPSLPGTLCHDGGRAAPPGPPASHGSQQPLA